MPTVNFFAFNGCMVSGITGPLEILNIADRYFATDHGPVFGSPEVVSIDGKQVCGFAGFPVPVNRALSDSHPDILVIPPCFSDIDPLLDDSFLRRCLLEMIDSGTVIATVCVGSFLLAGTGYLDGKPATTHWNLADDFKRRFPAVKLRVKQMLIDGGTYICAGGAMAWQDLSLHLVSRFMGRKAASDCSRMLVMDSTRHVQTPYFMFDRRLEIPGFVDSNIAGVQEWLQDNYRQQRSIEELAEMAGLGKRTFLRHFKRATGLTPNAYLQQLRVEAARHLLESGNSGVEEITEMVGYSDASSFRRLFKKKTGLSPREYRCRFSRVAPC